MNFSGIIQRFKSLGKTAKIGICVGAVVILLILITLVKGLLGGSDTNFYTIFNKTFSTKVGNYKYVIEVATSEHTESKKSDSNTDSQKELESAEAMTTEENSDSTETAKHSDAISTDWGNSKGSTVVDWTYPNYKITVTGRTESVDPLKGNITVEVATPYVNNVLFSATVVDGKYYIDLASLRNWLLTATDEKLVALASNIPENAVYLVMNDDELHFYSIFAEDDEYEVSGTCDVDELYNRFLILQQTIVSVMSNGLEDTGLSTNQDKYMLSISGDDSLKVYGLIKSNINSASSNYSTYIKNLQSNGLMTDDQMKQAVNERDNFLTYLTDRWVWINSASTDDLMKRNLAINGVADTFKNDKGESSYEISCSLSFTDVDSNTDYYITLDGEKSPLSASKESISIPTGSTCSRDELGKSANLKYVVDTLVDYFDSLDIFEARKLNSTSESLVSDMIDNFISLVNKTNLGVSEFTPITNDNVTEFISKYSSMKSSDNELDKTNAKLTQDLLVAINDITGNSVVVEEVQKEAEVDQFREVTSDIDLGTYTSEEDGTDLTGSIKIIANVNESDSNIRLAVVDAIILNTGDTDVTVDITNLSLKNMMSNKYPCNYEPILHEYDNGFDMSQAPSSVDIPVGGYTTVKLYSVIDNGWEYFDLFYKDDKLGDIVAY